MSGVSISISQFQPRLDVALAQLGLTTDELHRTQKQVLSAMGAWMFREMRSALKPGGAQGQPGRPLSQKWLAVKAEEGRSMHIGVYQGRMQNSISTDMRFGQLEVESGPTVEHAQSFDKIRPLTPKEDYAAERFQKIMIDTWGGW
jgi:hypothetical protein